MASMTWYDAYGRKVDLQALKRGEQAAPTIRGVRRHDALHPAAGLTPQRLARILRDSIDGDPENYLALAEDIEERDAHYAGVIGIRKRQVAGLDITVEAAGDDAASVRAADVVREVIARDGFEDELIDVLDAIGKGFSFCEIIWDTSAGQWRPRAIKWRDPRWFTFDRIDGETPMLRGDGGQPEPLRPFGWITHFAKAKSGLPIRGGIARNAAWAYLFKAYTTKDWAIFCEAYGQPLRLGKWGEGASEEDKAKLLDAVASIGADYSAIVPASMSVEFIKADVSGSHELYEKRADWLDRQVSKLVLGQTATTDAIAGGHAVGKTHDQVREDIEKADARQLAATLNRDLVRPVVDFELGPQKAYPKIRIGRPDVVDVDKLVKNVTMLVPFGLRVGMSTMRDKLGLPDPGKDEEVLTPARAPSHQAEVDDDHDAADAPKAAMSVRKPRRPASDAVDHVIDDVLSDWQPLVAPIVAGLEEKLSGVTSRAEAEAVLRAHLATMDTSELQETLARAFFAARLAGEADQEL